MKVFLLTICLTSALAATVNVHSIQKRDVSNFNDHSFHFPTMNFPFNLVNHVNPIHPNDPIRPSFPTHQNLYNDYYNHLDTHFLPSNHKCVKPYDLAAELSILSDSPDGYPLAAIDLEKANRIDLASYLPSAPAEPSNDVYEVDPNYSCPTTMKRLRGFSRYDGQCWILDENVVNFGYCANAYCNNHQYGSSMYTRNMCMEHFDTVYVWAYCDNYQDPTLRIRQEAIRLPKYCSCKSVRCY